MTLVNDLRLDTGDDTGVFASGSAASTHNLLSSIHLDTVVSSPQNGGIIIGSGGYWRQNLKGPNNTVLASISGGVYWVSTSLLAGPSGAQGIQGPQGNISSGTGEILNNQYNIVAANNRYNIVNQSGSIVVLPLSPYQWQLHDVKDNTGVAGTYPITVYGSGKNIDGVANYQIGSNWGSISFVYNGTQWNVV